MSGPNASPKSSALTWAGLGAGPLLACLVAWLPQAVVGDLAPNAQMTAAIAVLMAVWWMTEALPLPATGLLPLVLFPLTGVLTPNEAAAPYANKFVFLFLGGFMIARAVERWQLHRRIALLTVLAAGTQPTRLIAGFMIATAGLSMWISNTASTVMMLPIGISLVALVHDQLQKEAAGESEAPANFAICMMLGIAYAASIGGFATLIGTPTNLFLAGFAAEQGIALGFARWMVFALPMSAVFLVIAWLCLTRVVFPIRIREIPGGRQLIRGELTGMGPVSRGEWTVLIVFAATAFCWVAREPLTNWDWLIQRVPAVGRVNDTMIALCGALLLFVIPIDARRGIFALDWDTAIKIPWGVLLLFGGGYSLAEAMKQSQLGDWIGQQVAALDFFPTAALVVVVVAMVVFLTELTSNTPTAAAFVPILFGVAGGLHVEPLLFLIPATLAASCAFMLPVATPPNAIVFGSGHVPIRSMIRAGVWLNCVSIVLIPLWMYMVGRWVFAEF